MLAFLASLFGIVSPLISTITGQIIQAKQNALTAQTEQDRIAASEKIVMLEAQRDVLIQGTKNSVDTMTRFLLQFPLGLMLYKILIWDKILGLGTTDPISLEMWYLMYTIFGFYFVTDLTKILKR